MKRILFVPDCHHPRVNKRSWKLMLKAARIHKPDIIVVEGDFIDCAPLSSHAPDFVDDMTMKLEIKAARHALDELESLKAKELHYVEGNHETRLSRYLAQQAPALFNHVSLPGLLGLGKRWNWVPYRRTLRLGKLRITHDVGKSGINAHRQAALAYRASTIIGHTHRMAYEVRGTFDDIPYLAAMFGWLGDESAATYLHETGAAEWTQGFGLGWMENNGVVHVQPVPIINGKCCVYGRIVK